MVFYFIVIAVTGFQRKTVFENPAKPHEEDEEEVEGVDERISFSQDSHP